MKKHIPLLISCFSLLVCVLCIIYVVYHHQDLVAKDETIRELQQQKDADTLQAQIESLIDDNQKLREELYTLQNTTSDSNTDPNWQIAIEDDLQSAVKLLTDRDCSSIDMATLSKAAYDSLSAYCTESGYNALVPPAVYDSLDNLPKDKDITYTKQWADDFQIWSKLEDEGQAEVFAFYHYNNIPYEQKNASVSNYALYVTMVYDTSSDTWQIDQVHYKELLQSKFDFD